MTLKRAGILGIFAGLSTGCPQGGDEGGGSTGPTGPATGETGASETGAPTGGGTQGSTDETGTTDATGETGEPPAAGCNMPDPGSRADFTLDLGDWPGADEFSVDIGADCVVAAVTVGAMIETDLDCLDGEGMPHAIEFDVAASEGTGPVWKAGTEVELRVRGAQDFGGLLEATGAGPLIVVEVAMFRDNDGLLFASATQGPGTTKDFYLPLAVEVDRDACGTDLPQEDPGFPGPDRDMRLKFSLEGVVVDEPSVELFSGQRGTLPLAEKTWLAVDVGEATAIQCCHGDWQVWISRLVGVP